MRGTISTKPSPIRLKQQLHVQLREQLQQCPGQYQPGERADDALGQALAGGAEVGPAHEHDGQQHPCTVLRIEQADRREAGDQCQCHAQAMAEQHRAGRELLAQAHAHLAQRVRVAVTQAGIDVVEAGLGARSSEPSRRCHCGRCWSRR
ncbi:hypothetical protein G6F32_014128 [Rhizopus arrhizus]|nr:hypothetical protein G6F32_014128 [Rhizopus arrhizus]